MIANGCKFLAIFAVAVYFGGATVGRGETVGNPLVAAPVTDTAAGSIFVMLDPFTQSGTLTDFGLYDFEPSPPPPTAQVTPVLYRAAAGGWEITGIGAPRTTTGLGLQEYSFDLVAGSAHVGPGSYLGWKDGGLGTDNGGAIEFTNGGVGTVDWLGPGHTTFTPGNVLPIMLGLNRTYSLQADTETAGSPLETVGNPVVDAPTVDGAVGSLFVQTSTPFTEEGDVVRWRFFNGGTPAPRLFTPLILEQVGSDFVIRGIGQTINSNGSGEQQFPFQLVSGSAAVGPNHFLGWKDGGQGVDGLGVAEWTDGTPEQVIWFGGGHTAFAAGENLGSGALTLNRRYSYQATSDTGPPPPEPAHDVHHGQPVVNRQFTDSFHGSAIHNSPIEDGSGDTNLPGRVTMWSLFNDNPDAVGRLATPLLLEKVGGDYVVRGIGATIEVDASGAQMFNFALVQGTDTFDWSTGTFHMGIRYGSVDVSNPGVVDFDDGGASWTFIGDGNPVGPIALGAPITGPQSFPNLGRLYSMQFWVRPVPEPSAVGLASACAVAWGAWRWRRRGGNNR